MHMSIGTDSTKFVREASSATLRAFAFSSSVAATMPRIFFWFGQISAQTLNSMIVPSHAPMPITSWYVLTDSPVMPSANAPRLLPRARYQKPVSQVATAAQRNHHSARGAMYLLMPAPPGPPLSAAAAASPGTCTTLK